MIRGLHKLVKINQRFNSMVGPVGKIFDKVLNEKITDEFIIETTRSMLNDHNLSL